MNISSSDPATCRRLGREIERGTFIPGELYKAEPNGHKFQPGETRTLIGLVDFPEFNGEQVKITAIREEGPRGKAYYVEGGINQVCNWVYEYRLS